MRGGEGGGVRGGGLASILHVQSFFLLREILFGLRPDIMLIIYY